MAGAERPLNRRTVVKEEHSVMVRALGSDGGYYLLVQMRKLRNGEIRIWV